MPATTILPTKPRKAAAKAASVARAGKVNAASTAGLGRVQSKAGRIRLRGPRRRPLS